MNPDDSRQLPPNRPLSSGRDWQAEAVYGAMHPEYNPSNPNLRPVPDSQPTAPLPDDRPHMPGSNRGQSMPLPTAGEPPQQSPTTTPIPPTSYAPPRQQAPNYQAYSSMRKRRWPAVLLTFVIVALLGGAGYTGYQTFFAQKRQNTTEEPLPPLPTPTPTPAASIELSTLEAIVLNPPADTKGLTAKQGSETSIKTYTDTTGKCTLQFGTLPADRLPGANANEIAAPQLESLRRTGATVAGPTAADNLVLKDATDTKASYVLPTVRITFTHGNKQAQSLYSVAILKSGTRAFVSRSCVNADGAIDTAAFDALETKAKQLTITKQLQ